MVTRLFLYNTTVMRQPQLLKCALIGFFIILSSAITAKDVELHQGTIYVAKGKNTTVRLPSYVISEYNYNSGIPYGGGGTLTWSVSNSALVIATTGNFECTVYPRNNGIGFPDYVTLKCQFYTWYGTNMIDYSVTWTVILKEPDIPVTDITLDRKSLSICVNSYSFLSYDISPSNSTDKSVSWISSDKSVATVTRSGEVHGVSEGTAVITCMANDGSGVKDICNVKVELNGSKFRSNTTEGVSMLFQVIDGEKKTCRVCGDYFNSTAVDKSTQGRVSIPIKANGYTVVEVGEKAFFECKSITTVNLPSSVTRIGQFAFADCKSLSSITGLEQLEYIGELAFYKTPFYDNFPSGTNYIGKVLYNFKPTVPITGLPDIDVKEGTTMITGLAFGDYSNVNYNSHLSIPKSVKCIGDGDNIYAKAFGKIIISPDNPYYDSRNNCNAIIETASNCLIAACESTVIPENIRIIGNEAFEYIAGVEKYIIPDQVDSIADYAFRYNHLRKVSLGKSVRSFGESIFDQCRYLEEISVSPENTYYDSRFDCNAVIETATNKLVIGCKSTVIPRTVTSIGDYAFSNINGLTSFVIPDNIEEIGNYVFYLSGLETVTIGRGVKKMGERIFNNCYSLKDIYVLNESPITINDETIAYYNDSFFNDVTLHVPEGAYPEYRKSVGWNKFVNIVEFHPTGIDKIRKEATSNTSFYTLSGQRLNKPLKGINIINGKKVIVK